MAKTQQRVLALTFAVIFAISSVTLTAAVLWTIFSGDDQPDASQTINNESQEGKLEGTQLEGFTPVSKIDKLETIDSAPGQGAEVKSGDTVTVHYTGAVAATGKIFQSSLDGGQPVSFGLDQVIKGWTNGVPGMKEGGTRRILIPADQAYGANPPGGSGIPANADLVFDIQLIKIGQ